MSKNLRNYFVGGLASLLIGCVTDPSISKESDRVLNTPNKSFAPIRSESFEELPKYIEQTKISETGTGYLLAYASKHRDSSTLVDSLKVLFPDCTAAIDNNTNKLFLRVPYQGENGKRDSRLSEVRSFLDQIDLKPAQYNIQAYVMQVSATKLFSLRSSLDILVESGDVNFALKSINSNERPGEKGIQHSITGIFDAIVPTFQITALFDGLERQGFVYNLSQVTATVDDGEVAQVGGTRKVPVPKLFVTGAGPVTGVEYTDVPQSLRIIPRSRDGRAVELDVKITKGNVIPTGRDLYDISSRNIEEKVRVPLGKMLLMATSLEDSDTGVNESSPLAESFGSITRSDRNKAFEVVGIIVTRTDPDSPDKGWASEELKRQLERNGKP